MTSPSVHAGLAPPEIAFLCEMELVTVIPRQRLDSIPLLGGPTPSLRPPHRSTLPLWFALLLKRQRRCSIVPPPWLTTTALSSILEREISSANTATSRNDNSTMSQSATQYGAPPQPHSLPPFTPTTPLSKNPTVPTPPFQPSSVASTTTFNEAEAPSLPYHWLEVSHLLLAHASDDIPDSGTLTRLIRDLREVRQAKLRAVAGRLNPGAGFQVTGIGAMELSEGRGFLTGAVDGLRKLEASREAARKEEVEERRVGGPGAGIDDDEDEDMEM